MHHYNFPPFSVGETGFMRGPKRRDIGHGALAQRALEPMHPGPGRLPVHDPDRLGDARVERLLVDGLGLRLDARPDGRRRADQGAGRRASRWASSRRATTTSSSPTSRARRTTSATWTSRSPARGRASPRSRWTSRSPASRRRSWSNALEQAKRARVRDPRPHARGDRPSRARELAEHAPRISTVKINPEYIGMVIGKGGETIRCARGRLRGADRHRGGRHDPGLRDRGHERRRRDRRDHGADQGARRSATSTPARSSRRPTSAPSSS